KIKYIVHRKNKNASVARNTGFEKSSGEFISFLDDDDYMYSDKIEKQMRVFQKKENDYGLVYCGGYYVKENGRGYIKKPNNKGDVLFKYMTERIDFNTSTILIPRFVMTKLNGFDESFYRHQDWEFCSRVINDYPVFSIQEPLIIKFGIGRNESPNPNVSAKR